MCECEREESGHCVCVCVCLCVCVCVCVSESVSESVSEKEIGKPKRRDKTIIDNTVCTVSVTTYTVQCKCNVQHIKNYYKSNNIELKNLVNQNSTSSSIFREA